MKILLFGKNGQLGWELQRSLSPLGNVVALDFDSTDFCGDFTDLQGLADTVKAVRPDIIVNAAAYTAVDKAESEPELARLINARAPEVLANAANSVGACFIHYSTDYVFDGSGSKPWLESDIASPLNVYGDTKFEGERLVADACENHFIFRTSWVYSVRGSNFAKTMLRLASERESLSVINDQFGAPTGADLLADITAHVIRDISTKSQLFGTYHLTASGETSWFDYAKFVLEYSVNFGATLKVDPGNIVGIPSSEFPTAAKRPLNSRLNTKKLQDNFGFVLPNWELGVARMISEMN